jgi:hypothetical protein
MATFKDQVSRLNNYPTPTSFKFWGNGENLSSTNSVSTTAGGSYVSVGTALDMIFTALNNAGGMLTSASATNGILPSATAATYGAAFVVAAPNPVSTYGPSTGAADAAKWQVNGVSGIIPLEATFILAAYDSGTVTMDIIATYNDATTVSVTKTATANGTTPFAIADMLTFFVNNKYITSLALQIKNSAASSTVTATGTVYGSYQLSNIQIPAFI